MLKKNLKLIITTDFFGKAVNLARKLEINSSNVNTWLTSSSLPTIKHLMNLKEKLGLSIDWLLTGEGEPYIKPASTPTHVSEELAPCIAEKVLVKDERGTHSLITQEAKRIGILWQNLKPELKDGILATLESNQDPTIEFTTANECMDKLERHGKDALTVKELHILDDHLDEITNDPTRGQLHIIALETAIKLRETINERTGQTKGGLRKTA